MPHDHSLFAGAGLRGAGMSEHVKRFRYRVGCAGMFELGQDYPVATEDEAIAACESPPGCQVFRLEARAHGKRHG